MQTPNSEDFDLMNHLIKSLFTGRFRSASLVAVAIAAVGGTSALANQLNSSTNPAATPQVQSGAHTTAASPEPVDSPEPSPTAEAKASPEPTAVPETQTAPAAKPVPAATDDEAAEAAAEKAEVDNDAQGDDASSDKSGNADENQDAKGDCQDWQCPPCFQPQGREEGRRLEARRFRKGLSAPGPEPVPQD